MSEGDATLREIVWGHLHHDFVTGKNAYEVQTHFSGNVCENAMPIDQLNSEHGIWQQLDDFPFYFNSVFLGHVKISGAPSVTSTVCSK